MIGIHIGGDVNFLGLDATRKICGNIRSPLINRI